MNVRALLACLVSLSTLIAADKPNVLIIFADDLGYADIGRPRWQSGADSEHRRTRGVRRALYLRLRHLPLL